MSNPTTEQEVNEELALDYRVYGSCYWKVVDGKKVRIHPRDIRYGRDGIPRDSTNTEAARGECRCADPDTRCPIHD